MNFKEYLKEEETPRTKGGYELLDTAIRDKKIAALKKFYKGRFQEGPATTATTATTVGSRASQFAGGGRQRVRRLRSRRGNRT